MNFQSKNLIVFCCFTLMFLMITSKVRAEFDKSIADKFMSEKLTQSVSNHPKTWESSYEANSSSKDRSITYEAYIQCEIFGFTWCMDEINRLEKLIITLGSNHNPVDCKKLSNLQTSSSFSLVDIYRKIRTSPTASVHNPERGDAISYEEAEFLGAYNGCMKSTKNYHEFRKFYYNMRVWAKYAARERFGLLGWYGDTFSNSTKVKSRVRSAQDFLFSDTMKDQINYMGYTCTK